MFPGVGMWREAAGWPWHRRTAVCAGGDGCTISAPLGRTSSGFVEAEPLAHRVPQAARQRRRAGRARCHEPARGAHSARTADGAPSSVLRRCGAETDQHEGRPRDRPRARPHTSPFRSEAAPDVASTNVGLRSDDAPGQDVVQVGRHGGQLTGARHRGERTAPHRSPARRRADLPDGPTT